MAANIGYVGMACAAATFVATMCVYFTTNRVRRGRGGSKAEVPKLMRGWGGWRGGPDDTARLLGSARREWETSDILLSPNPVNMDCYWLETFGNRPEAHSKQRRIGVDIGRCSALRTREEIQCSYLWSMAV